MVRRFGQSLILAIALAAACAAPTPARADDPGYVRQFLAIGNWRHVDPDRQLIGPKELPFEGYMTMGRLWTVVTARDDGFVDLNVLGPVSPETALVHLYVFAERDSAYQLLIGSDDRAEIALNGQRIHRSPKSSAWRPDQEKIAVRFAKGWNRLLLRVDSAGGLFGFSLRFALPDGRPVSLKTATHVPDPWLNNPQLKRPLTKEGISDLLDLLDAQITSVAGRAARKVRAWQAEGQGLDPTYARARVSAETYVAILQTVLETIPAADDEADQPQRRRLADAARKRLLEAALAGPYQLTERTRAFVGRAERGARLWRMVRPAATTAHEAGRQAAEVDRALVEARALLAAVSDEYLRPYLLREKTLQHRTGLVTLRLADADGNPLADAEVHVEQLAHEFLFGCNLFAWGAFDSAEDQQRYEEHFLRIFNLAVVPVYWSLIEPVEGRADYVKDTRGLPGPEPMIQWCRSRALAVRASPILSNEVRPVWLRDKPVEETARLVEAAVRSVVGHFKGQVDYWDVSTGAWPTLTFSRLRLPVTYLFAWAAEADPGARLLLSHAAPHALVQGIRLNGRRPFGLGGVALAARQAEGAWPAEELDSHLQRLKAAEGGIHLDRVMIPGPPSDEQLQARHVEQFYRTAMADPAVRSITWWDLSDRFAHLGAAGGLLRKDLTPKPAYQALARLIRQEWRTDAEGPCDGMGRFRFRGFFGRYRVRAMLTDGSVGVWEINVAADRPRDITLTYPPESADPGEVP